MSTYNTQTARGTARGKKLKTEFLVFSAGDRVEVNRGHGHFHEATIVGACDERWNTYRVRYDESVLLSLNGRYVSADPYITEENVKAHCISLLAS